MTKHGNSRPLARRRDTLHLRADANDLSVAAGILRAGGIVAFPTETVYGLGADATSAAAVAQIYAAKSRPAFNPLIAHVATRAEADVQGRFTREAMRLADAFWPGPLTLVLAVAPHATICELARAGLDSVALRVPSDPTAQALLALTQLPIAAPSANVSGRVSPVTATHVREDLDGAIDAIVAAPSCQVGLESTIVSCLGPTPCLLRPGGICSGAIESVLGRPLAGIARADAPRAPGMLKSHYAPRARLRLDARYVEPGEAGLDFGARFRGATPVLDLSPQGDVVEAAANFFDYLRRLDREAVGTIAVAPIPDTGLGEAINDRLRRAAADA